MNQDNQPEAMRLADELEQFAYRLAQKSARELRRLHAESELHQQELASYRFTVENREARIAGLEARVLELEAEKARLVEDYVPYPSATEAYLYGIKQEK